MLAEAGVKDYLWKTEHDFKAEELDLRDTFSKELTSPLVNRLKDPPRIAREWDERMAFMITVRHLVVGPPTAEDIKTEQGMPGGFTESARKGNVSEPETPQRGEGSNRQQRLTQQTQVGDSVEKEAAYAANKQGSDHRQHETTRATPARPGPLGDSSSEESDSESDQPRSPPLTTQPEKTTIMYIEREKSTEEQEWESLSGVNALRTTTKISKALKGLKLDPPETLYVDDNKWKNLERFDRWVNALQRFLIFNDIDLNDRSALEFVGFKASNIA